MKLNPSLFPRPPILPQLDSRSLYFVVVVPPPLLKPALALGADCEFDVLVGGREHGYGLQLGAFAVDDSNTRDMATHFRRTPPVFTVCSAYQ